MSNNNIPVTVNTKQPVAMPFTVEELHYVLQPRTLFRRTLVERTHEEFRQNPQLGLRLTLIQEEAQIASQDYAQGKITEAQYLIRMRQLRRDCGNIIYQ